eukprot:CAMPEP_0184026392 /NCGR_PEP_ID=MMETSP0954-20121128/13478_1 /TAXON_ID=627963 /ORGANISM="Aplanochytrium sp, Strain PBS07" /LENGTH=472 /DNA_ID=CAMNT_0026310557 /DNA_START=235 /DNA_END=1653 /DNA_ORIENTATION=-
MFFFRPKPRWGGYFLGAAYVSTAAVNLNSNCGYSNSERLRNARIEKQYDVVVIGGGILGCSVAYSIAGSGLTVGVLERGSIGCEASSLAAGTLCNNGPDLKNPCWYDYLSIKSRKILYELETEYDIDIDLVENGVLTIAETEEEKAYIYEEYLDFKSRGGNHIFLASNNEVSRLEGSLRDGTAIAALFAPSGGHVDPAKLTHGLCEAAMRKGAIILENERVISLERMATASSTVYVVKTSSGMEYHTGNIVIATGCHDPELLNQSFGIKLPIIPVKGQIWVTEASSLNTLNHVIYNAMSDMVWDDIDVRSSEGSNLPRAININPTMRNGNRLFHHVYGRQTKDGYILFGGDRIVVHDEHLNYVLENEKLKSNFEHIKKLVPQMSPMEGAYCCYMPFSMLKDGKPLLGELARFDLPGMWVAVGFGPSGIALGPEAGNLLAKAIRKKLCQEVLIDETQVRILAELDPCRENWKR